MGCDTLRPISERRAVCFNSRTPCGVRPSMGVSQKGDSMFQFTHPVWGATQQRSRSHTLRQVSIHAPRVGCDFLLSVIKRYRLVFQFTHPVWGATDGADDCRWYAGVSIHAPRVGCDARSSPDGHPPRFQFTHPVWGATSDARTEKQYRQMFQFTHPVWGATVI